MPLPATRTSTSWSHCSLVRAFVIPDSQQFCDRCAYLGWRRACAGCPPGREDLGVGAPPSSSCSGDQNGLARHTSHGFSLRGCGAAGGGAAPHGSVAWWGRVSRLEGDAVAPNESQVYGDEAPPLRSAAAGVVVPTPMSACWFGSAADGTCVACR